MIAANDPRIMVLVDNDLFEAKRQLEVWMFNHPINSIPEARNPLTLKIFPTFFQEPEEMLLK